MILGTILFLNYINDFKLENVKLFVDDTFIFLNTSINNLNNDICEISEWEIQLKMCFSSDKSKQRNEVIFSGKMQQLS